MVVVNFSIYMDTPTADQNNPVSPQQQPGTQSAPAATAQESPAAYQQGAPSDPFASYQAYQDPTAAGQQPYVDPNSAVGPQPGVPIGGEGNENPFVPGTPPPPPAGAALKKIFAVIVLVIAIAAVVFLIISIVRKVIKKTEKVNLTYWGLWEDEGVLEPLIAAYQNNHPGVTISYTKESPKQYRQRLQASIKKGSGPDIFRFHNTWLPMLQNELAAIPSNKMTPDQFKSTFYPIAASDLISSNNIYGIPLEIDGLALYYNEDLFKAAGVVPPKTWDDLRNAAMKITVRDEAGAIITAGAALGTTNNIEHFSDIVAVMMLQNGADLKNPTTKEAQDAIAYYRLFAEAPNNVWDKTLDNSVSAFASGKVAMIFAPSWQALAIKETNPGLQFAIIPIPQLAGANIAWASYWVEGVSSASKQPEAAWDFLLFLGSKETMGQFFTEGAKQRLFGEPYSRVDLASTLQNDPLLSAYVEQAPLMQSFFLASRTFDDGINDRMIKYLEDAVNGQELGVSPEAALTTMASGFTQVMRDFGYKSAQTQ